MHSLSFGADLLVEGAVRSEERRLQRRNLIEGRRSDGCGGAAAAAFWAAIAAPMVPSCAAAAVNSSGTVLRNDIHCSLCVKPAGR